MCDYYALYLGMLFLSTESLSTKAAVVVESTECQ